MIGRFLRRLRGTLSAVRTLADLAAEQRADTRRAEAKNPLCRYGSKVFSQSDEDGITMEIVRRIGIEFGTYCELGVSDGRECNTLVLAIQGWSPNYDMPSRDGHKPDRRTVEIALASGHEARARWAAQVDGGLHVQPLANQRP